MLRFEETDQILDEIAESIPETLLEGLNGGIVLMPDTRRSTNIPRPALHSEDIPYTQGDGQADRAVLWLVCHALSPFSPEQLISELECVVRHELRHHIETRTGCDDLARVDAEVLKENWRSCDAMRLEVRLSWITICRNELALLRSCRISASPESKAEILVIRDANFEGCVGL